MGRVGVLLAVALLSVTLFPTVASTADRRPVVAVFDIQDTRTGQQKLQPDKLRSLTDYLATRLAIGGKFKIVPRESVHAAIAAKRKDSYKECYDNGCQIDIGREIAAQKSLATKIDMLGDECIVTSTLYDLRQSATENSATYRGPCGRSEILTAVEQIAAKLRGDTGGTTAKNIRFDTSGLPAVPVLQMPSESDAAVAGVDFSKVDVDAMEVFDAAVKAEKDDTVPVERKIGLWEVVKKKAPAYRKHAAERIIAWRNLAEQKKQVEAIQRKRAVRLMKDWKKLQRLQKLSVISAEDKQAWNDAFYEAYREETKSNPFVEDPAVSRFIRARGERELQAKEAEQARLREAEEKRKAELARQAAEKVKEGIVWVHSAPAGIDFTKTEVTVAQYRACVEAGRCSKPYVNGYCNFGNADRDQHPVNCVDLIQAEAFCEWAGGRLPTEDEWFAEASNKGSRQYPWGDEKVTCDRAIFGDLTTHGCGRNSTWPVCSTPRGKSVSELCDMSGNVWEWTSTSEGDFQVIRGGSWVGIDPELLLASGRSVESPLDRDSGTGLRCGRSSR